MRSIGRHALATLLIGFGSPVLASPAALEKAAADLKPLVVTDPATALHKLADIRRRARNVSDRRARVFAVATAQRLEAEALLRLNQPAGAAPLIRNSIEQVGRLAPRSRLMADLLLSRGGLHIAQLDVADALSDFQNAHAIFRTLGDRRAQASALLSIAFLYAQAKDYQSVLKYADQAREVYRDDPLVRLSIYNNRADALKELSRNREAEAQLREALQLARSMNSPLLVAQVTRNIARVQLLSGRAAEAERTVRGGYVQSARAGEADERAMLALGARIVFQRGRLAEAAGLIGRSFAGVDLSTTQLASREAHETAYRIHAARRESAMALVHLEALKRLDDEATKLATSTGTALMGARFDFANQELRIASLQRDEARRTVAFERARADSQQTIFLGGAAAVAIIIVLLSVGLFTIRRSRNQVRAVAADLTVSNHALGKALAAKTEFLATTSHEIRTPLNGILGMTQVILADRGIEPVLRDRLQLVHAAGTTMRALVDDILDVAKMETGNLTIEDAPFDPAATLTDAARLWEEQVAAKGIAFRLDVADCPAAMLGDAARVRQLAFNLLSNALKFTRAGSVTLAARAAGDRLIVTVADTGIGIPADKLEEIFESFRQADAGTTREFGGTGLGLAICRNLAEAMGGSIAVESEPGCGSTFTVTLPLRVPVSSPVAPEPAERSSALLVVERNPIVRAMLRTLLAPHAALAFADNRQEAEDWIEANDVLGVLADAGSLDPDGQASIGSRVGANRCVLLCADEAAAAMRRDDRWIVLARPIAGARLIDAIVDQSVISNSDTLAAQAA